jgi:uncharacterized tellurite resistance protein B-like protein
MLHSLKSLLVQFFNLSDESASSVSDSHSLQLATAVLLIEVMRADAGVNDQERASTVQALRSKFALTDDETQHLLSQADSAAKHSNDYFRYTSAMNEHFTQAQKIMVVELMWQVAYADGDLDAHENHIISKVASLLHVTHGEYIAAKLHAKQAAGLT